MGGLASGGCDRPVRKRRRLHACPAGTEGPRRPSSLPTVRTDPMPGPPEERLHAGTGAPHGDATGPVRKRQRLHAGLAGTESPRRPSPRPTVRTGPHRPDTRPAARRPGTSGPRHNARRPTFQHPACSNYTPARALGPPPDSRPPRRCRTSASAAGARHSTAARSRKTRCAPPSGGHPRRPHRHPSFHLPRTGPNISPPSRDAPRPDFRKIFAECASI